MAPRILIVEDNSELRDALVDTMKLQRYDVDSADDGNKAMRLLNANEYDVVVLDWHLPGMSGLEILDQYRSLGGDGRVIMLTGKDKLADKGRGFAAGADDYVTKPAHVDEIAMRVRALLRRTGGMEKMQPEVLKVSDIELDVGAFRVTRAGVEIRLLPREFALLAFLMKYPGRVFSAEQLIEKIWESNVDATSNAVAACVRRLRNKIDREGEKSIIETIYRTGYKLDL